MSHQDTGPSGRQDAEWARLSARVYRFFGVLDQVVRRIPDGGRVLDLGCASGSNFGRLRSAGASVVGVDVSLARLRVARASCPVAQGIGERLPFRDRTFDLVYVSHVLHHAADHRRVLGECHRVLRGGGRLFLIETVDDHPLMRLARNIRPEWDSDEVRSRFRFADLAGDVRATGFRIEAARQFNVGYWIWETAQDRLAPLARLHWLAVAVEERLAPLRRWGAHAYFVASSPP
jgi:SAM-dependent methyltransferase